MRQRLSGADDGLDEEQEAARPSGSARRPRADRGKIVESADGNGTVAELFPNRSNVRLDSRPGVTLCNYRMATLTVRGERRERSPVCVGDRVRVEGDVIIGRCRRRNALARLAPNSRLAVAHVIVANVDVLVVVAAVREPDFTPGLIARLLAAAAAQGLAAIVCANKVDLLEPGSARPWMDYAAPDVAVIECSARDGAGIAELERAVGGKAAAFCGNSGVGKTSLLRRLLGDDSFGRVAEVSAATGQGRHSTAGAVLLPGPRSSTWIDTPGIMDFRVTHAAS